MKTIGLTGGIGTGKTTVAKIFASLGVPIFEADKAAKHLVNTDQILILKIKTLFGSQAYLPNQQYNSPFIAEQVYKNPDLLTKLNSIVHPEVAKYFEKWKLDYNSFPYVIREAAIISKEQKLDLVVLVSSPLELRIARIQKRDPNRSLSQIEAIMAIQKTEAEYLELADIIIKNDENSFVTKQVLAVHKMLST